MASQSHVRMRMRNTKYCIVEIAFKQAFTVSLQDLAPHEASCSNACAQYVNDFQLHAH